MIRPYPSYLQFINKEAPYKKKYPTVFETMDNSE